MTDMPNRTVFHPACGYEHPLNNCPLQRVRDSYKKSHSSALPIQQDSYDRNDKSSVDRYASLLSARMEKLEREKKRTQTQLDSYKVEYGSAAIKLLFALGVVIFFVCLLTDSGLSMAVTIGLFAPMIISVPVMQIAQKLEDSKNDKIMSLHQNEKLALDKLNKSMDELQPKIRKAQTESAYLKKKMRNHWEKLSGWAFEKEVAGVFRQHGYDARVTPGSNDGGIDINMYKNGQHIIVQCKNYKSSVGPAPVRELYGSLMSSKANQAMMVIQTSYTSSARLFAEKHNIKLMNLDDIISLYNDAKP